MKTRERLALLIERIKEPDMIASVFRGAGAALTIQLIGYGLNYVSQVLLARWMGASEYGTFNYVMAWAGLLVPLTLFGLPAALLRLVPLYTSRNDLPRLQGLIRGGWQLGFAVNLTIALLGTALLSGAVPFIAVENSTPYILGLWLLPLLASANFHSVLFRAFRQIIFSFAPLLLVRPIVILAGAFVLFQTAHSLTSTHVLSLAILALLVVVVVQQALLKRALKPADRVPGIYAIREWLSLSLPLLVITVTGLAMDQTDILMIGSWLGARDAGIYAAASKTANTMTFVLVGMNTAAMPLFASLHAQEDRAALQHLVRTAAKWSFWPSLFLGSILIIFSDSILRIFGADFVVGRFALIILVLGKLVDVGTGSVLALLNMTGHHNESLRVYTLGALVNAILNAIGIYFFGINGAAVATAASTILWNLWLHALVVSKLGVYPSVIYALASEVRGRR